VTETPILQRIQVAVSEVGARVFRNQVGKYKLQDGRWLSSGLCVGSSDLIGWKPVMVTAEMVGKVIAVFTAIEVKTAKTRATKKQEQFMDAVRDSGGVAFVARSEQDALRGLDD